MTKDKDLETLFSTAVTTFDDNDKFTSALSDRLDKAECVKRICDSQKHGYSVKLVLSFVAGGVSVILALLAYPSLPTDSQIVTYLTKSARLMFLGGHTKICSLLLIALITFAVFYFILSLRDISLQND